MWFAIIQLTIPGASEQEALFYSNSSWPGSYQREQESCTHKRGLHRRGAEDAEITQKTRKSISGMGIHANLNGSRPPGKLLDP